MDCLGDTGLGSIIYKASPHAQCSQAGQDSAATEQEVWLTSMQCVRRHAQCRPA